MKTKEEMLKRGEGNFFHCTDYEDAIEAMEAYASQSKWISVDEQKPKVDEIVLVYIEGLGTRQGFYDGKIWSSIGLMSGEFARKVTHWQSLPEKP